MSSMYIQTLGSYQAIRFRIIVYFINIRVTILEHGKLERINAPICYLTTLFLDDYIYMNKINSKLSQKGSSMVLVIVVLVLVLVGGGLLFLNTQNNTKKETVPDSVSQSADITGFKKVDSDVYTFYYPENYVDSQQLKSSGVLAGFENPKKVGGDPEVIFVKMQPGSNKNLEAPTFQLCTTLAEKLREKQDDKITTEVTAGGQLGVGNGKGCKIVVESKVTVLNDTVVTYQKLLWNPSGNNGNMYIANATYFKLASKDEAVKLGTAVDNFTLK